MKEALRYLNNAREILKSTPVENGTYIYYACERSMWDSLSCSSNSDR
jgi:hypothetical protein